MPCINVVRWALQACSAPGTRSPGFRGDADANTIQPISISTVERSAMDLIADRGRRVAIEELNTTRLLAHARKQAQQRKLYDILIVYYDAHLYDNESMDELLPIQVNFLLRQLSITVP